MKKIHFFKTKTQYDKFVREQIFTEKLITDVQLYEKLVSGDEKLALVGLGYVGMPIAVAGDGRISKAGLEICGMSEEKLKKLLKDRKTELSQVFVLITDGKNDVCLIKKEDK